MRSRELTVMEDEGDLDGLVVDDADGDDVGKAEVVQR